MVNFNSSIQFMMKYDTTLVIQDEKGLQPLEITANSGFHPISVSRPEELKYANVFIISNFFKHLVNYNQLNAKQILDIISNFQEIKAKEIQNPKITALINDTILNINAAIEAQKQMAKEAFQHFLYNINERSLSFPNSYKDILGAGAQSYLSNPQNLKEELLKLILDAPFWKNQNYVGAQSKEPYTKMAEKDFCIYMIIFRFFELFKNGDNIAFDILLNKCSGTEGIDFNSQLPLDNPAQASMLAYVILDKMSIIDYLCACNDLTYQELDLLVEHILQSSSLDISQLISSKTFIWAIAYRNHKLLDLIAEYAQNSALQSPEVIQFLMSYQNIEATRLLMKRGLSLELSSESLLMGITKGFHDWICWALEQGLKVDSNDQGKLMQEAVAYGNLKMIKTLQSAQSNSSLPLFQDLVKELNSLEEEQKKLKLYQLCLNSPLENVYELMEVYPEFKADISAMMPNLPYAVRFPVLSFKSIVSTDHQTYTKQTEAYAKENAAFVQTYLPQFAKQTWHQTLAAIMANRIERNPKLPIGYTELRVAKASQPPIDIGSYSIIKNNAFPPLIWSHQSITPIVTHLSSPDPRLAYLTSRYTPAYYFLMKERESGQLMESENISTTRFRTGKGHHFQFYYTLPNQERVPTTRVLIQASSDGLPTEMNVFSFTGWFHTPPESLLKLEQHMEELHQEIIHFKLDSGDPASKKALMEKIARGYWLVSTMCETERGTPHNAMMWLNLVYSHHGLPPPIPKQEFYFLDNIMLMMPIDKAIKEWENFFEPLPKV